MDKTIQMRVPAIGQQPPQVDISQSIPIKCKACSHNQFEQAFRLGAVSRMAPGNKTGQDLMVRHEIFICINCGVEAGKEE